VTQTTPLLGPAVDDAPGDNSGNGSHRILKERQATLREPENQSLRVVIGLGVASLPFLRRAQPS
jgi:hypothetical protein